MRQAVCEWAVNKAVLGAIIAAARRHGLRVGLYYSLWDRHEPSV